MKIGKTNIFIDWRSGIFWILMFIYILGSTIWGLSGFVPAIIFSAIATIIYLSGELLGGFMGPMGGAGFRPNYVTPGWLVRGFAWIFLLFFISLTIYMNITQ